MNSRASSKPRKPTSDRRRARPRERRESAAPEIDRPIRSPARSGGPTTPLLRTIWSTWSPPPPARAVDWIPAHVEMPDESETPGPFSFDLVPHARGVLETVDDPSVRNIILVWAARNAKTTTALSCLLYWSATAPRPSVFCSSNEELADRTITEQLYPLIEKCAALAGQLPPPHRRNKRWIKLARNRIRRAYSGSRATLRGYPACYGVASEVSAWSTSKNVDASALRMLAQRGKLYPFDSKFIYESTPGLAGACQITELFDADGVDRRARYVPCPHCRTFQTLVFGDAKDGPGIKWDKDPRGFSTPQRAEETAFYRCVSGCEIHDCDRPAMMRAGIWVSEGQTPRYDARNRIVIDGQAKNAGSSTVGFGPLSTLHSLRIAGWGQIAREFLEAKASPEGLRDFTNSTLALPWDPKPRAIEPTELAQRLVDPAIPREAVPPWAVFLTAGFDVQEHATAIPFAVSAWGPGGRGHLVSHGVCGSFDEVRGTLDRTWPMAPGSGFAADVPISLALIDCNYKTDDVYRFVWSQPRLKACRGSSSPFDQLYKEMPIEKLPGATSILVNTWKSQDWIQRLIDGATPRTDPAFYSLPAEAVYDLDLLDQLMNEVQIREIDDRGYPTIRWVRRNFGRPNDKRDAIRYAWTAAQILTQHGVLWNQLPARPIAKTAPPSSDAQPAPRHPLNMRRPTWSNK